MPHESNPTAKKLEKVVAEKTGALSPDDTVKTAGDRMRSADANAWPVAEGRKLVGSIDHPDPDLKAGGHGHDPLKTKVGELMTRDVPFCYEDQDAAEAHRIMVEKNLKHLPVVDRDMRIVRIIARAEVCPSDGADGNAAPPTDWQPKSGSDRLDGSVPM